MPDITTEPLEIFLNALDARDGSALLKAAEELHYADIADVIEQRKDVDEREFITITLGSERLADIIPELPEALTGEVLGFLKSSQQKAVLQSATDDDRVDILQDLDEAEQKRLLELLPRDERQLTRQLLTFGEETAGGRMTTQIGRIRATDTVRMAIDHLKQMQEETETLARIFVCDEKDRVVGKLRLRDLTFNPVDMLISDLMKPVEHRVLASTDQEEAAMLLRRYDLVMLPIVDEFDRLLGVITYDDAMEILEQESTEDIEKMSGISGEQREETYLQTPFLSHISRRLPWLIGLAGLAVFSGLVMLEFEDVLTSVFLLSLFLPMVVASGGNSGGQAATMVIRAMSLGELRAGNVLRVALKELRIGAALGFAIALSVIVVCTAFGSFLIFGLPEGVSAFHFGAAVGVAIFVQVTLSTLIGAVLPLGARAIKLDPAVVASPAITTIVDVSGMAIYFVIARLMLGLG